MPNWCVNQVDITGDEAEVAKLVAFVKNSLVGYIRIRNCKIK